MDSTNSNETSADDINVKDDLFKLVEKLRIELHKKDEELQVKDEELTKEKEEKQKLSADLDSAMSRLNLSHINTAMDSSTQTSADDAKHTCICSKLFDLSEKLGIELQKRDEDLAKEKQEKQKLLADLALEKARADKLETDLNGAHAQEMIEIHQMSWDSFPCPNLTYNIETHSGSSNGGFLYFTAESHYYYLTNLSAGDDQISEQFKFTRNSDGTFSIYNIMEKYLHTNTDSDSSRVEFTANKDNAGKFVLFFHHQSHHIGLLVDICTMDGYFLHMDNDGYVVAYSRTPPAPTDKFMITPDL